MGRNGIMSFMSLQGHDSQEHPQMAQAYANALAAITLCRIIIIIIIIIIRAFVRRTMSASELNLRRRQSLGGEDG